MSIEEKFIKLNNLLNRGDLEVDDFPLSLALLAIATRELNETYNKSVQYSERLFKHHLIQDEERELSVIEQEADELVREQEEIIVRLENFNLTLKKLEEAVEKEEAELLKKKKQSFSKNSK